MPLGYASVRQGFAGHNPLLGNLPVVLTRAQISFQMC